MASTGQATRREVLDMLTACTDGWRAEEKTHFIWIYCNGLIYRSLPKHPKIQGGHIKQMIRFFGISLDCAKEHLKMLQG